MRDPEIAVSALRRYLSLSFLRKLAHEAQMPLGGSASQPDSACLAALLELLECEAHNLCELSGR